MPTQVVSNKPKATSSKKKTTVTKKITPSTTLGTPNPKEGKHLVIVESPAKCKTIAKYL
jgi:reverse gyrase